MNDYFNIYIAAGINIIEDIYFLNLNSDYIDKKKSLMELHGGRIISLSSINDLDREIRLRKEQLKNYERNSI